MNKLKNPKTNRNGKLAQINPNIFWILELFPTLKICQNSNPLTTNDDIRIKNIKSDPMP